MAPGLQVRLIPSPQRGFSSPLKSVNQSRWPKRPRLTFHWRLHRTPCLRNLCETDTSSLTLTSSLSDTHDWIPQWITTNSTWRSWPEREQWLARLMSLSLHRRLKVWILVLLQNHDEASQRLNGPSKHSLLFVKAATLNQLLRDTDSLAVAVRGGSMSSHLCCSTLTSE